MKKELDQKDHVILASLRDNCCMSRAELARTIGLTPTAVFERIRKLEGRGLIEGYSAILNPAAFGKKLSAFVFVSELKPTKGISTGAKLTELESVDEVYRIAGKDCFLLRIRVEDTTELTAVLDKIGEIETVRDVQTTIVLDTLLERAWGSTLSSPNQKVNPAQL